MNDKRKPFQVEVTEEQLSYTRFIVEYSCNNFTTPNIWDESKKNQTKLLRFIGSLGEVVFADVYNLPRPKKSFGAIDGQDCGRDFILYGRNVDIKTQHRKSDVFYNDYVANISKRQINDKKNHTDFFYILSVHKKDNKYFVSFLGVVPKLEIIKGRIGTLHKKGDKRTRKDNSILALDEDIYEIKFQELLSPLPPNEKVIPIKIKDKKEKKILER